jgi:hypothetical protein
LGGDYKMINTVEITEEKVKKLQKEFGMLGAMKVMCILYGAPLNILHSEDELNKMIVERNKVDEEAAN